jgi:hypothetical protein
MRLSELVHSIIARLTYLADGVELDGEQRLLVLDVLRAHFDEEGERIGVSRELLARIECADCEKECTRQCNLFNFCPSERRLGRC